ncbi:hypothetical protein [Bifidobacterium samirii]|uniref:Uncharacterized protein n=1 Tax=Bifidobacterium samirii TaxID=2306974 RepID=A0A430FUQ2_9BIFI|nr:hypothetical protein [Bifidobacterium samirii]RSX57192.1 hypothetical protein D2E24_0785 [Bifidobacterium samirii]
MAVNVFHAPRIDAAVRLHSLVSPDLIPPFDMRAQAIVALLRGIAPDEDGRRSLWITAPRGTVGEFAAAMHDEAADSLPFPDDEQDDEATVEATFRTLYPDEERWYRIDATLEHDEMHIRIDDGFSILLSPDRGDRTACDDDADMLMDWLLAGIEDGVRACAQGTYDAHVRERLPYDMRFGTIARREYLRFDPQADAYVRRMVSPAEARRFSDLARTGGFRSGTAAIPFDAMTLRRYADICRIGYEALGLPAPDAGYDDANDLAWLDRYGDPRGRVTYLFDVDSPEAFAALADDRRGDARSWNVRPGPGFEWMALVPVREDDGWSLLVDPAAWPCCAEAVPFALALADAGVPVEVDDAPRVAAAVLGTDLVGVVPRYVTPSRRAEAEFPGPQVGSVMQLPAEGRERFVGLVDWMDPEPVRLLPLP